MKYTLLVLLGLLLIVGNGLSAELQPASLFQDHMVLQRGKPVPVWGTADAGKAITVKVGTQQATGKADDKGNWRVDLPAMEANATGQNVTITDGDKTITLADVLIGDVWVCSGQSNMGVSVENSSTAKEDIPQANHPDIRLFRIKRDATLLPKTSCGGTWSECTPDTVKKYSAVAYYFGRDIAAMEKIPVALVLTQWAGTKAEAWTRIEDLQGDTELKAAFGDTAAKNAADATKDNAGLTAAHNQWLAGPGKGYGDVAMKWFLADDAARRKGEPPIPQPKPAEPEPPADGNPGLPTSLFNGMISPLEPLAIKGVIWYQGESNVGDPLYAKLFPVMIEGWRKSWGQGDFPFIYVQLPNVYWRGPTPPDSNEWADAREVQLNGLKIPMTGMAVTIDAGDGNNLHPPYKNIVGHRLALAAEHVAYGRDLVDSGPLFDSVKIDGAKATITFKNTGTGLKIGALPIVPPGTTPPPTDKLVGFAVAGSDRKFAWADATITGPNTVSVSSSQVAAPMFVRYGWGNNPEVNLYNSADLPASPFRTDTTP
jgi:sialate O-acetylesterase